MLVSTLRSVLLVWNGMILKKIFIVSSYVHAFAGDETPAAAAEGGQSNATVVADHDEAPAVG